MHLRTRIGLLAFLFVAILFMSSAAEAREVVLTLSDGSVVEGELENETERTYTIRQANGRTQNVPKSRVTNIADKVRLEDEYRARREQVKDDDEEGRFQIAYWLFNLDTVESVTLCLKELEGLKKGPAVVLASQARLKLDKLKAEAPAEASKEDKPAPRQFNRPIGAAQSGDVPRPLTEAEINRLKAWEIRLNTPRPPRVIISDETADKLFQKYRAALDEPMFLGGRGFRGTDGLRDFKRMEGFQKLDVIFSLKAREFYDEVIIRDEPETLQFFRTKVHNQYVLGYCGKCHHEGKAAGLNLLIGRPTDEAVAYTNLVLLARTETPAPPRIGGGEAVAQPLILREHGADSPLLQFGMPPDEVAVSHPQVEGWKPFFRPKNDPRLPAYAQWIAALSDIREGMADYDPASKPPTPAESAPK